jgi:hypothetical protein
MDYPTHVELIAITEEDGSRLRDPNLRLRSMEGRTGAGVC